MGGSVSHTVVGLTGASGSTLTSFGELKAGANRLPAGAQYQLLERMKQVVTCTFG